MTVLMVPWQEKTEEESELRGKVSFLTKQSCTAQEGRALSKKQEPFGIHGTITVTRTMSALSAAGNESCLAFVISSRHTLSNMMQYCVIQESNFSLGSLRKQGVWDHDVCQSSVTAFEPGQP